MRSYDRQCHHRRSIRLLGYDYTQPGAYFITIVTHDHIPLFGDVVNGVLRLNPLGEIVRAEWFKTAELRPYVRLVNREFVVMPNHVHGIIWIVDDDDDVGARCRRAPTTIEQFGNPISGSIPTIVRAFKSAVTKRIDDARGTPGAPLWQRNYYEHIIRDDNALHRISEYIATNPLRWQLDRENPVRVGTDEFDTWWEQYRRGAASLRPYRREP